MRNFAFSLLLAFFVSLCMVCRADATPQQYRQAIKSVQAADEALKIKESWIVKTEASKIMPVLEHRIKDPVILAKTRDKLLTLHVEEIRLVSSLCDQVSASERTARADIVFSLVTALIVLS